MEVIPPVITQSIRPELGPFFDIEKLLNLSNGAVILDLGSTDAFYRWKDVSPQKTDLEKSVRSGRVIPVNPDAFSDFGSNHVFLHSTLMQGRFPIIPTITRFDQLMGKPLPMHEQIQTLGNYSPQVIPGVYVHKKSGPEFSHGGKGVSVIREGQVNPFKMKPLYEFIQPFIIPPADETRQWFVRDTRVMLVGGKAVAGVTRRAEEPLSIAMLKGKALPGEANYPTATRPGKIEEPSAELWAKVSAHAENIAAFLSGKLSSYPNRLHSPFSTQGYFSMDFLQDSTGQLLPVDYDLQPMVRPQIMDAVSTALAENMVRLAKQGSQRREIIVIGEPTRDIVLAVLGKLYDSKYPQDKIAWQDYKEFYQLD